MNYRTINRSTKCIGETSISKESLDLAVEQTRSGNRIGDIGFAVQNHAESNGYGVVRELVGHGLGRSLHEKPEVPNYVKKGVDIKVQVHDYNS
jgi:methionyl aminopeptidase